MYEDEGGVGSAEAARCGNGGKGAAGAHISLGGGREEVR